MNDVENFPTVTLAEGDYQHPIGTLVVSKTELYLRVSLKFNKPVGNAAMCEWFFNLDGSFDGTGTELAEPVAEIP